MPTLVLFISGLGALVTGAELLVRGASRLALSLGHLAAGGGADDRRGRHRFAGSGLLRGGGAGGQTDIAVGNVVGSNIFNVLLILGVSALIVPLVVDTQIVRQEVPIMIGASVLLLAFGLDGRVEALALLALMVAYVVFLIVQSRREQQAGALAAAGGSPDSVAAGRGQPATDAFGRFLVASAP
ncbi:MAG TPA: hypothetical protein VEY92_11925 [Pseudoxanthomonas sp.]|nr:hypothetical protein [Pseudoxanthomonas sp.]